MTNKLYHRLRLRASTTLILALSLSTFPAAFSRALNEQTPATTSAPSVKTSATPASESKGGQKEGIKVHGHWIIDVRNPDGTLVTRREFENALLLQGKTALAKILARLNTPGLWEILLFNVDPGGISPWSGPGFIVEANDTIPTSAAVSKTLTVIYQDAGPGVVLSGTITAAQTGVINSVQTEIYTCSPTVSPSSCSVGNVVGMTATTISSPVSGSCAANTVCVVAGQIIQVTVTISFS